MENQNQHLETLHDIKKMMERSSRFISLSGLSGIAAGVCALVGAYFAHLILQDNLAPYNNMRSKPLSDGVRGSSTIGDYLNNSLFQVALLTFIAALVTAFIFTYLRSKKTGIAVWGTQARRVLVNVAIPMLVGGIFLLKLIEIKAYGYIAPGCLIFYGLALLNAGKYTWNEVRYLAFGQMLLGIINLWIIGYGLYFWAFGFGVLHIVYGAVMWWKYERSGE